MGEILGLGCTHWPILIVPDDRLAMTFKKTLSAPACPDWYKDPANWPEELHAELAGDEGLAAARAYSARLADNFRAMRKQIDDFQPDAIIIWGDDQYENFREDIVPPFCVLAYEEMAAAPWRSSFLGPANRWNEPEDFTVSVQGAHDLGKLLARDLIDQGIDMAYAYRPLHEPGLSHAFLNTILFLDWDRAGFPHPVIPMPVNCYGSALFKAKGGLAALFSPPPPANEVPDPPSPTPRRCMEVGAAIADFCLRSDNRFVLMASASWSHAFLSPRNGYLWSDMESDRLLFDSMRTGNYDVWRQRTTAQIEHAGQHEVLNWMMLIGAMERLGRVPVVHDYIESHLFTSQKCFVSFPPEQEAGPHRYNTDTVAAG